MFLFGSANTGGGVRLAGLDPEIVSHNEEGRPLPLLLGRARVPLHWFDSARNPRSEPINELVRVGKKKNTVTTGFLYSADMVAGLCLGPIADVREIWSDGELVWSGAVSLTVAGSPVAITVPNLGVVHCYPGDDVQDINPWVSGHPAYRGQAYTVWRPMILGENRTSAPQIEVVVSRPTRILGWSNPLNEDGVCPVHALVELLTNPVYGLGIPLARIDAESALATSAFLTAEGIRISPVWRNTITVRQTVAELLEYFGGFFAPGPNGRIYIGSWWQTPDFATAPTLGPAHWSSEPEWSTPAADRSPAELRLMFTDRTRQWKSSPQLWHDPSPRTLYRATDLPRPAITAPTVAQRVLQRTAQALASPAVEGRASLYFSPALAQILFVGSPFYATHHGETIAARVTRLLHAPDGETMLEFAQDPGAAVPSAGGLIAAPTEPVFAPEPLVGARLLQLPETWPGNPGLAVTLLGARAHPLITGYTIVLSTDGGTNYPLTLAASRFAAQGTLSTPLAGEWKRRGGDFYADVSTDEITFDDHDLSAEQPVRFNAGGGTLPAPLLAGVTYYADVVGPHTFRVSATPGGAPIDLTTAGTHHVNREFLIADTPSTSVTAAPHPVDAEEPETVSPAEAASDTLVLFVGAELISVETVSLAAGPVLTLGGLLRGRFGSSISAHPIGTPWLLSRRAAVPVVSSPEFIDSLEVFAKALATTLTSALGEDDVTPLAITLEA